jgi:hypothetical protein
MVINGYLRKGEFIVFDIDKPEPAENRGKAEAQCKNLQLIYNFT